MHCSKREIRIAHTFSVSGYRFWDTNAIHSEKWIDKIIAIAVVVVVCIINKEILLIMRNNVHSKMYSNRVSFYGIVNELFMQKTYSSQKHCMYESIGQLTVMHAVLPFHKLYAHQCLWSFSIFCNKISTDRLNGKSLWIFLALILIAIFVIFNRKKGTKNINYAIHGRGIRIKSKIQIPN